VGPGALCLGPRWLVLPSILAGGIRTLLVWAGLFAVALLARGPQGLFFLPRARPALWLAIILLYPIFSVYPQEVMYRTFFFHRHGGLLPGPRARILVNAALFGWAHVIVHNLVAMLLTVVGGALFALTYQRSRSTLLVSAEHALYGAFVFTVGIGGMFVTGVRLLSRVMR
jgi:membrane protease YdiL (CAAX protease family)